MRKTNIQAVDLFCGVGGLTYGLKKSGINVRAGVDLDPACKYPFEANNQAKFFQRDITDISANEIQQLFSSQAKTRLIAGCAPCQTFSSYNQKACNTDSRWWLLREFSGIVERVKPELVTMENVPGLEGHAVFVEFIKALEDSGYYVHSDVVECAAYGVPQTRKRLVVLASRLGPIKLLSPKQLGAKKKSVRDAIGDLPPVQAGEISKSDPFHQAAELSELNLERIKASRPGGTWRDWNPSLVAECHRKETGKTYPGVYGRMTWDDPGPTMTTQYYGFGNGRFGHPEQDRAISLREGAILQSFPKKYKFTAPGEPIFRKVLGRLIGNAVPVRLGWVIGKSFVAHIRQLEKVGKT